jgi:hypothetical protein
MMDPDEIRRLVLARCGDVLTEDDLDRAFGADAAFDRLAEIADRIFDVIETIEERLTKIEQDLPRRSRWH